MGGVKVLQEPEDVTTIKGGSWSKVRFVNICYNKKLNSTHKVYHCISDR